MPDRRGMTLTEILVTVSVLAILAGIVFNVVPYAREKAEGTKCAQNMRSLYVSLSSYIQEQGHWPQEPEEVGDSPNTLEDWWLEELKPYGGTKEVWRCPTIYRRISSKNPDGRPLLHYTPAMFDESPYTPYRWPNQPWLSEIGNMHGRGALICFPDGSIRAMDDVVKR
jgi:prepilin-type N-terminal cleavage/methylation domain-containing protein